MRRGGGTVEKDQGKTRIGALEDDAEEGTPDYGGRTTIFGVVSC